MGFLTKGFILNDQEKPKVALDLTSSIGALYGPYAFGVIALLTIWFSIVKPELNTNRLDYDAHRELINQLGEMYNSQSQIAKTMERTAEVMSATSTILKQTIERSHDVNK